MEFTTNIEKQNKDKKKIKILKKNASNQAFDDISDW